MKFFYDAQIRRYLLQIGRIFAEIYVQEGPDENNAYTLKRVPIRFASNSKLVASILNNFSTNITPTAPQMVYYIKDLKPNEKQRRNPTYESTIAVMEREFDSTTNEYTNKSGNKYTVNRYMPVPYTMTIQMDILVTNQDQKFQILEQLMSWFNPSIQLQQNDNLLDWSSLFEVKQKDIILSNLSIPIGGNDSTYEIASMTFEIDPVWVNPPAKVEKVKWVETIVTKINDINSYSNEKIDNELHNSIGGMFNELSEVIVSYGNYKLMVGVNYKNNILTLLTENGTEDKSLSWVNVFEKYGGNESSSAKITLKTDNNIDSGGGDLYGSVVIHPTEKNKLIMELDIDSLPAVNTVSPITSVIDPKSTYPTNGLPPSAIGQRYMLVSDDTISEEPVIINYTGNNPWGDVVAYENDIIEFNGTNWITTFDSRNIDTTKYTKDIDGNHYTFDGKSWKYTTEGIYNAGYWRLHITKQ